MSKQNIKCMNDWTNTRKTEFKNEWMKDWMNEYLGWWITDYKIDTPSPVERIINEW